MYVVLLVGLGAYDVNLRSRCNYVRVATHAGVGPGAKERKKHFTEMYDKLATLLNNEVHWLIRK